MENGNGYHKSFTFDEFNLETELQTLRRGGEEVHLAIRPFQVLLFLVENRERVVSRGELLDKFWDGHDVYDDALRKCVGAIRKALDDTEKSVRFIETRRGSGYRFIGSVSEPPAVAGGFGLDEEIFGISNFTSQISETQDPGPKTEDQKVSSKLKNQKILFAVLAVCLISFAALAFFVNRRQAQNTAANTLTETVAAKRSIAILPIKNLTGDAANDYLSDGITEGLINEVSRIESLKVISRSSAFQFKNKDASAQEIGEKLGVDTILEGGLRQSGDQLRVEVRLVNTKDGSVMWANDSGQKKLADIFAIQDGIACQIAAELKGKQCGDSLHEHYTENVAAYQAYLKGRYYFNNQYADVKSGGVVRTLKKAVTHFEQAIQIDPNYAPAYAGLADAYTGMMWFLTEDPTPFIAKSKEAAAKAVLLDDTLAEAHTALANAHVYEWDFQAARREHELAVALNPRGALTREMYAFYLMIVGRNEEMLAEAQRAEELDPLNLFIIADRGSYLAIAGRYDEAIAQFRKWHDVAQDSNPDDNIANCYLAKGMTEEALKELQAVVAVRGRTAATLSSLAYATAVAGRSTETEHLLTELTLLARPEYVSKTFFANIYAAQGRQDAAFAMLEQAYLEHDPTLLGLKQMRAFDPLRPDPRFADLLRRVGL